MTEVLERATVKAPARVLPLLEERVAKVAKAARRLGVPEPEIKVYERWIATATDELGIETKEEWVELEITGKPPKLEGGWKVVAAVEHYEGVGNIVRQAPEFQGQELGLHEADARCEHCGLVRSRKLTVLLEAADGTRKRVGSSCIKDFLGYALPSVWQVWAQLDDVRRELDEEAQGGWAGGPEVGRVVALAAAFTLRDGFAGSGSDYPTKVKVQGALFPRSPEERVKLTDEEIQLAKDAIKWIEETPADSDYLRNLKVASRLGEAKHMGLLVSLPFAYLKEKDRVAARERVETVELTEVLTGAQRITGQIETIYWKDTDWGSRQVMTVLDQRGFKVWGTVPSKLSDAKVGAKVSFEAEIEAGSDTGFGFFKRPKKAQLLAA